MDTLRLTLLPSPPDSRWPTEARVVLVVNGRSLLDPLGEPLGPYAYTDTVTRLACQCGEAGCWPLLTAVAVASAVVAWRAFEQPPRRRRGPKSLWRYDRLGPFVFSRLAYETELT